jgi:DNA-binding MarR family transcriptional regulator
MRRTSTSLRRENLGFLLAKATQRWNELLAERFKKAGYGHIRPSYGSLLVPLFEEDGLRLGELAKRARLSKQTMTTMVRLLEREKLVRCRADDKDARATRVYLSETTRRFRPVAERVIGEIETIALEQSSARETEAVRAWLKRFAKL